MIIKTVTENIALKELLKKTMQIMLKSSGAERGVMVFNEKNEWYLKITGSNRREELEIQENIPLTSQDKIPGTLVDHVIRRKKAVVLNDARQENMFSDDAYITLNKPLSILCIPLMDQGEIVCVLYLENNLTRKVFSADKMERLSLTGSLAASCIKNVILSNRVQENMNTMTHELKNPLMGIEYLLRDFVGRPGLSEEDQKLFSLGVEECQLIKKLLKEIRQHQ